jgi:four helix bundle protein
MNEESFRQLKVWQLAMDLVTDLYRTTARFPPSEKFFLTSQLRRAGVSVPANIGEGKRRKRQRALLHHLDIALGSQGEIEVQLEIAWRVGFLQDNDYRRLQLQVEEVGRMLNGLMATVEANLRQ